VLTFTLHPSTHVAFKAQRIPAYLLLLRQNKAKMVPRHKVNYKAIVGREYNTMDQLPNTNLGVSQSFLALVTDNTFAPSCGYV